jgi:hypothetical protein
LNFQLLTGRERRSGIKATSRHRLDKLADKSNAEIKATADAALYRFHGGRRQRHAAEALVSRRR